MTVAHVVEISTSTAESFEDAVKSGVARPAKKLQGKTGDRSEEQKVVVDEGKIKEFRANMRAIAVFVSYSYR
ncbi:MAG: dodecin family protein [Deltaproteobacteria bacterium]|nr:dodecin family protein [Deltaproteobacteria bacterium]